MKAAVFVLHSPIAAFNLIDFLLRKYSWLLFNYCIRKTKFSSFETHSSLDNWNAFILEARERGKKSLQPNLK